jgi:hypothetical protein
MDVFQRRRLVALSIVAVLFIVLVLLIRGCGGDDEPTVIAPVAGATGVGGATALTQAGYIDQADAACLEANTSLASVDQADPATAATEEGQILAGELESLQTLPAPEEGADDLDAFLSALQDQVASYGELVTALERGDDTAAAEIQTTIDEAATKAQEAASAFGLDVCGDLSQTGESSGGQETTTGGAETATETTPVAPTETTAPPVVAPPADEGGVVPATPAPTAPADGGTDSGSGGITP